MSLRHYKPLVIAGLLPAFPASAEAHLAIKGIGDVGNGMLHPLITPAHVLIMLGLGLMLGQQIPLKLKTPMLTLAVSSAVSLAITCTGSPGGVPQALLIGIALAIGLWVAVGKNPHRHVCPALCFIAGVGICLDSGVEAGPDLVVAKTLAGTWITVNAVPGYLAICASNGAGKPWAMTGIRVLGSWIFAISLLVLAFALKR